MATRSQFRSAVTTVASGFDVHHSADRRCPSGPSRFSQSRPLTVRPTHYSYSFLFSSTQLYIGGKRDSLMRLPETSCPMLTALSTTAALSARHPLTASPWAARG
jgi:hypothetical protein